MIKRLQKTVAKYKTQLRMNASQFIT